MYGHYLQYKMYQNQPKPLLIKAGDLICMDTGSGNFLISTCLCVHFKLELEWNFYKSPPFKKQFSNLPVLKT